MRDLSKFVRVSQILSIFQKYDSVPTAALKKAQDTGTAIHAGIEKYWKGEFEPLGASVQPYFQSFLSWATEYKPKPLFCEERVFDDELRVTGQVDLIAEIEDQLWIVDFKTGSWVHSEIWEMQLHWYYWLLRVDKAQMPPENFLVVKLQKDGTYPTLYPFVYDEDTMMICLHALECWKFFNKGFAIN